MFPHLSVLIILGISLLWSSRIVFRRDDHASRHVLVLVTSIAAWVLILLGIAAVIGLPFLVLALVIFAMVVARYRAAERRALLWTLATASERGIPLHLAATAYARGRSGEMAWRCSHLGDLLAKGIPLPDALRASRNPLPADAELAARMGQATQALPAQLLSASHDGVAFDEVTSQLYGSYLYLAVVLNMTIGVISFLMIKVAPTFETIMQDFDMALPALTALAFQLSSMIISFSLVGVPLIVILNLLLVYMVVGYMGWSLPEIPVLSGGVRRRDAALALRAMADCVDKGRPIPDSLRLIAEAFPKQSTKRRLVRVVNRVNRGEDWCAAMVSEKLVSQAGGAVLSSAGRVNNLAWALREQSDAILRKLQYRTDVTSRIIAPLLIFGVALPVGIFAVAMILPLISIVTNLAQ